MKIKSYKKDKKTYYRFCLYAGIDPVTEKQKQIRRSGFETRQAAELAYAKLKASESNRSIKEYRMDDVCDLWLRDYEHTVKGSTYAKAVEIADLHIKPFFKNMVVSKITARHAQDFTNQMYRDFVKGSTYVAYTKRILKFAQVSLNALHENPFNVVMRPRKKKSDKETMKYYDKEELKMFLLKAKEILNPMWYTFLHLMAYTGMRRGEVLALKWSDIDFAESVITISKTVTRDRDDNLTIESVKTEAGERVIDIDSATMGLLNEWKEKAKKKSFVFYNRKGSFLAPTQPGNQIRKVTSSCGLRHISPHGFRHTHCSMLFAAGVSLPQVQARLGHTDIRTTMNIYNHLYKEDKKEAVNKFIEYLS